MCPFVKALEFDPTGFIVTRVEFVVPADMGTPARDEKPKEPEEPEPDYPRKRAMP
jgi:hypothetical protein